MLASLGDILLPWTLFIRSFHLISAFAWMAGLFYLPRLFVYHAENQKNPEICRLFLIMESRLLRIIMNPAMVSTFIFGTLILCLPESFFWGSYWIYLKLFLLLCLAGFHGMLARWFRLFKAGQIPYSSRFFRCVNEVPTVLLIAIVMLAIFKPF